MLSRISGSLSATGLAPKRSFTSLTYSVAPFIRRSETDVAAFVGSAERGPLDRPVRVFSLSQFERIFGGAGKAGPLFTAARLFFANGGHAAWILRVAGAASTAPKADAIAGSVQAGTGLHALTRVHAFNTLCLPDVSDMDALTRALSIAARRRALLLIDPPAEIADPSQVLAWIASPKHAALRDSHAAAYFPRLRIPDVRLRGADRSAANSGAVAGLYARVDAQRGVWKAPAGLASPLVGVTAPESALTDAQTGRLVQAGINPIREYAGHGTVIWGSRTLVDPSAGSEWRYVAVKRLGLMIEDSLVNGIAFAAGERNDARLWSRLRLAAEGFFYRLYRDGALQGRRPSEAYFVRCDASTTTHRDVAARRVNMIMGLAPLRPAQFIVLQLSQRTL